MNRELADRLNAVAVAQGYDGMSDESLSELAEQLNDPETAALIVADYADRLGVIC